MSGHARQRGKKGQWYAVIDVSEGGKRKRRWLKLDGNYSGKREARSPESLRAADSSARTMAPMSSRAKQPWLTSCGRESANGKPPGRFQRGRLNITGSSLRIRSRRISAPRCCASYGHSILKDGTRHCAILAGCEAAAVSPHKQSATRIGCYRKRFAIPYRSVPIHHWRHRNILEATRALSFCAHDGHAQGGRIGVVATARTIRQGDQRIHVEAATAKRADHDLVGFARGGR